MVRLQGLAELADRFDQAGRHADRVQVAMETEARLGKHLAEELPEEVIERERIALPIRQQPLAEDSITIAEGEGNALLHLGHDPVEGGEREVALPIDDLGHQLGADQVQAIDGLHQRIGHVELRRAQVPLGVSQGRQGQQRVRGGLVAEGTGGPVRAPWDAARLQAVGERETQGVGEVRGEDDDLGGGSGSWR
jgi:hypothetical protein